MRMITFLSYLSRRCCFVDLTKREVCICYAPPKGIVTPPVSTHPILFSAAKGDFKQVEDLVRSGADINREAGKHGYNALHLACAHGHRSIAKLLMESGANLEARTNQGLTPFLVAALNCHIEIVKELLARGADSKAVCNEGRTAVLLLLFVEGFNSAYIGMIRSLYSVGVAHYD